MNQKFIMMPVLIPGPKQPGNDIDVYLKPLIEDLLLLWKEEGVRMWDAHAEEHFNLRALLFVTTNDWLALSNLSRQSNKGYRACTHCLNSIKVPSGYSSNIKWLLNLKEKKFAHVKSHDCHVLMTQLIPIALRGILLANVRATIIKLCAFLNTISQNATVSRSHQATRGCCPKFS